MLTVAAVVRRRRVVHHKLVRALRSVVSWDAELWSSRVLNRDRLTVLPQSSVAVNVRVIV